MQLQSLLLHLVSVVLRQLLQQLLPQVLVLLQHPLTRHCLLPELQQLLASPLLLPLVPVVLLLQLLLQWLLPQLHQDLLLLLLLVQRMLPVQLLLLVLLLLLLLPLVQLLLLVQQMMLQEHCHLLHHQAAPAPSSLQSTTYKCADRQRTCCRNLRSRTHQGSIECMAATANFSTQQDQRAKRSVCFDHCSSCGHHMYWLPAASVYNCDPRA
jgi:hypothetical protein